MVGAIDVSPTKCAARRERKRERVAYCQIRSDAAGLIEASKQTGSMIRTGAQYREGLRDGREVWIDGERVKDICVHPAVMPIVDIRARIYDMQHEPANSSVLTYFADNDRHSVFNRLPMQQQDWHDKRNAVDAVLQHIKGVVNRVGDETVGEMWSLYDGRDVLSEIDPRFAANITRHIDNVIATDVFHVSANTDPKGDRSKPPQEQDPDMMVHVVKQTGSGIIIRGAKFETASAYADQAFLEPTIGAWTNEKLSDYAVGCIVKMGAPGVRHIARSGFANRGAAADYPLASRFDEVDFLMVLDDVHNPWEDVFFYRHTRAAQYIRGTLHRYSGRVRERRIAPVGGEVLRLQRGVGGRGSAQVAGVRARPLELGLCRPSPDLRAVRSGPAFQSPRGRLRRLRFFRAARLRAQCRRAVRQGQAIGMTCCPTTGIVP